MCYIYSKINLNTQIFEFLNHQIMSDFVTSELPANLVQKVMESKKMVNWLEKLSPDFEIDKLDIQTIDMFGPNVGFVKFNAEVKCKGEPVPGITFMRGGSVAILIILSLGGEKFILCTKQARFPIGDSKFLEIPAGMMDEDGNFLGVAAKELEEETHIKVDKKDLISLGGAYPSPGGCDEYIEYFALELIVDQSRFDEIQGAATGNLEEGEKITLQIIPYREAHMLTDSKALCAILRYERFAFSS
jgi:ADP-sugar diphosphatase